jgi:CRP-like cAMP-binding protein
VAVTDTAAIALDAGCLRQKCDADPRLGYALVQRFAALLVQRLHATRLRLVDLYGGGVP